MPKEYFENEELPFWEEEAPFMRERRHGLASRSRNLWSKKHHNKTEDGGLGAEAPSGCVEVGSDGNCTTCNSESFLQNGTCQCSFNNTVATIDNGDNSNNLVVLSFLNFTGIAVNNSQFDCAGIVQWIFNPDSPVSILLVQEVQNNLNNLQCSVLQP